MSGRGHATAVQNIATTRVPAGVRGERQLPLLCGTGAAVPPRTGGPHPLRAMLSPAQPRAQSSRHLVCLPACLPCTGRDMPYAIAAA